MSKLVKKTASMSCVLCDSYFFEWFIQTKEVND